MDPTFWKVLHNHTYKRKAQVLKYWNLAIKLFLSTDDGQEMSQMRAEKQNQKHRDLASPDQNSPLRLSEEDKLFSEQVSVKQEKSGEVTDGSACCLDSIKVEDLSPECILAVESQMLEEWKPEVLDIPSQDPITDQFCTGPALGKNGSFWNNHKMLIL